ncbi:ABC transporter permease [Stackebrandtia soli]|uniref:ABC transporter permease n=1 Tax=Stackebrandtia soli TaxID=1892856 RepID=UPI0039E72D56
MTAAAPPARRGLRERIGDISSSRAFPYLLSIPLVIVLWGFIVAPMLQTAGVSGLGDGAAANYGQFLNPDGVAMEAVLTSIGIALASVVCCAVVGTAMAFLLARFDFPGRRLIEAIILIPSALPPLIGAVAFQMLYSNIGIVPRWLQSVLGTDSPVLPATGIVGVLVVHTFTMYPFFYLAVSASLVGMDTSIEEAAANLGSGRLRTLRTVTLPMLTPALVSGSLIVFMVSMASYTAPLLFNVDSMMTMQIVLNRTNGNLPMSATYSSMLAIISLVFLLGMRWYEGRRSFRSMSKGVAHHRREVRTAVGRWTAFAGSILATVVLLAPVATIALVAFSQNGSWTSQIIPSAYTFQNFVDLFGDERTFRPIANSLSMSAVATAASIVIGVLAAYLTRRYRFVGRGLLDLAVMLPWALPGTVVAVNLISAFSQANVFSFGNVLVGTFWILPLAYFVRFMPLVFRSTNASLAQMDPALEEAARSLGSGWLRTFRTVTLPVIHRGILAGALLAFVNGVGEFVASVLIYTKATQPISVAISNRLYSFDMGTAAAYGMLQVALIFVIMLVTRRLESRGGRERQT